ncbi:MAG: hypothetical protein OEY01_15580 [Desulfobulbaceae bacterium]|nr:hypothetical protein [Desulfobulbaceae bacterium]
MFAGQQHTVSKKTMNLARTIMTKKKFIFSIAPWRGMRIFATGFCVLLVGAFFKYIEFSTLGVLIFFIGLIIAAIGMIDHYRFFLNQDKADYSKKK